MCAIKLNITQILTLIKFTKYLNNIISNVSIRIELYLRFKGIFNTLMNPFLGR